MAEAIISYLALLLVIVGHVFGDGHEDVTRVLNRCLPPSAVPAAVPVNSR